MMYPVKDRDGNAVSGMKWNSQPGHAYLVLNITRLNQMPDMLKRPTDFYDGGTWFEEDLEWCRVVLAFPELFETHTQRHAHTMMSKHHPDIYYEWKELYYE